MNLVLIYVLCSAPAFVLLAAFHHIDNHLDLTPLEYMLQRYQTGEDREELSKANRTLTEEEEKKMKDGSTVVVEGVKRTIEDISNRKKLKQSCVARPFSFIDLSFLSLVCVSFCSSTDSTLFPIYHTN